MLLAALPAAAATPRFTLNQVDVDAYPVVRLVVHSRDASDAPTIYENGKRVRVASFQNLGRSKAIVLAIDRSKSMTGAPIVEAAAAAGRFLHAKRHSDQVSLVTFGSTALAQTPLEQTITDADAALKALEVDAVEGTALYDAVVVSAAELAGQPLTGRVLVLLTDGRNVRSLATFADAVKAVHRANAVVYTIALGDAASYPLKQLAKRTGGSFYSSPTPAALDDVYRRITSDLDHTWRVSYPTAARPGETISVTVGQAGGRAKSAVLPGRSSMSTGTLIPAFLLDGAGGILLLLAVVGLLVFLAATQLQAFPRSARIKRLVRAHTDPRGGQRQRRRRRPTLVALATAVDRRLRAVRRWERLERLADSAALPVSATTLGVGGLVLGFALAVLSALMGASGAVILLLFLAGFIVPLAAVKATATRRIRSFDDQLPEVLAIVASSLRVGHGLKAALQAVADEGAPPTSVELRRVLAEERLGRPLEEALVAMCERLGSEDLLYVATAVDIQSQVGGSLAGVFSTVAETVRQRQQHRSKVRALTASGRSSAIVLSLLPVAFVTILVLISPGYMLPFIQSDTGHVLLIASVISISIGALLLNRIVNVKG